LVSASIGSIDLYTIQQVTWEHSHLNLVISCLACSRRKIQRVLHYTVMGESDEKRGISNAEFAA
jgi:hypothetical protein